MKFRAFAPLAALSLLVLPSSVQAAKPAEVELHIEATAQVAPDRAVVPLTITGSGETEAAARADLRKNEDLLLAALVKDGFDASRVKAAGAEAGKDGVTILPTEEDAACAAAAAATDATNAALDAAAPTRRKGKSAVTVVDYSDCTLAIHVTASKSLLVTLDDLTKVDLLQTLGSGEGYPGARLRPVFSQSDPAAARKKARADALAKANAEADAYADAMGYRVVRIVRVSNARPQMSMFDLIGFFANMENKTATFQPSWFGATVVETVAIDYVIAPK